MLCCLNAHCQKPLNPDNAQKCRSCSAPLVQALRGRYRPVRLLGQGGFGRTYLAQDKDRLNAKCVIKQFVPQVRSSRAMNKAISLFNQEAVRLYELGEHPQIPALLAYFEQGNLLYLVQQYIEGHSLAQELSRQGPFNEIQLRSFLLDILPTLQFVHSKQVIHRDITPMNILRRNADGRMVLIDFGVAKQLNMQIPVQPGTRIGTEGYSPIEQFRGGQAYPASDIYSLGATCLHLLTNTRPDYLYDPLNGEWIWQSYLADQKRSISDEFAVILNKMLRDMVNDRYQTVAEVLNDLSVLEQHSPSAASALPYPAGPYIAGPRVSQSVAASFARSPSPMSTSGMPASGKKSPSSPSRSNGQPKNSLSSRPPVAITSPPPPLGHPSRHRPPSPPPHPRRSNPPSAPLSPSSVATSQGGLKRLPLATSSSYCQCLYATPAHTSWVTSVAINPMTDTFASSGLDDQVRLWNTQTGKMIQALMGHARGVNTVAFSPDGKLLISGSDDYSIKIWNAESGKLLRTLVGHDRDVTSVSVSADGNYILSGGADRSIRVWDLTTGQVLKSPFGVASIVRSIAVSEDGSVFVSGGLDRKLKLWSMKTAELARSWTAHRAAVTAVTVSTNSQMIGSASKDQVIKLWDLHTGKMIREFKGHKRDVNAIAITPDNRYLISGSSDASIRIWDTASGKAVDVITDHTDSVNAIAVDKGGKCFISASSDRSIRMWHFLENMGKKR